MLSSRPEKSHRRIALEVSVPSEMSTNPHPVTYFVTPQIEGRNRLTCFFRIILAIPHLILVGGPGGLGLSFPFGIFGRNGFAGFVGNGALGVVAAVCAVVSWFAILFTGKQPKGLWDLTNFYLRWRSKAVAYSALLRDEYPPFGEGEYPVDFGLAEFPEQRNKWTVALRIFYVIPHAILLFFLGIAWAITRSLAGWRSCSRVRIRRGCTGLRWAICAGPCG